MSQEINRMLLELERCMRSTNREIINPVIQELTLDQLQPVLKLVANARARYLKALFDLGGSAEDGSDTDLQFDTLAKLRREYEELASAAKALETAIQRGYVDIAPSRR